MIRTTFCLAAMFGLFVPAAMADALLPPAQHTDLQKRLVGLWQEQACHSPPAMHHSEPCEIRTIAFGDSTIAVLSSTGVRDETTATAASGTWAEDSSSASGAVIHSDVDSRPWTLTFPDKNSFVITGYDRFPDAQFKRVVPVQ